MTRAAEPGEEVNGFMVTRLENRLRHEGGLVEIVVALAVFILLLMLAGHRVVVQ